MITRSTYTKQLRELDSHISRLGEAVVADVRASGIALAEGDKGVARGILDGHSAVHRLHRSVEDSCMSLMLLQQPLASDLRLVTASFRAVSDLARIDEMACDIALLDEELDHVLVAPVAARLRRLSELVATMVGEAVGSFGPDDAAGAEGVFGLDDEVDRLFSDTRAAIVDILRAGGEPADAAPELLMVAKYYERMGDHAQSLADWAIFRATGRYRGHLVGEAGSQ